MSEVTRDLSKKSRLVPISLEIIVPGVGELTRNMGF